MYILLGVLTGLVWGAAAAFVNSLITKKSLEKQYTKAALAANYGRLAVDLAALGLIFLLRGLLPFSYEACLITTALTLSAGTLAATFILSKKMK